MHSLGDDNELDRLSRDAAEMYSSPASPNWRKMSAELDKALPVDRRRRFALLWWLVPAVLLAGGGYLLTRSGSDRPTTAVPAVAAPVTASPQKPATVQPTPTEEAKTITPENPASTTPAAVAEEPRGSQPSAAKKEMARTHPGSIGQDRAKTNDRAPIAENAPAVQPSVASGPAKNAASGKQPTNTAADSRQNPGTTQESANVQIPPVKTENTNKVQEPATTRAETQPPAETQPMRRQEKPAMAPFGRGFSLAFIAGADKSTVKFTYGNDPGYNLGILAGYYLNSHLSFHAGAVYTQKNYKMAGEDFTAPKGSLPSYYKLENVEGYCRMWDVPLLVRYTFSPRGKNNFYLSTGLSSYFMTNENYNYFFYSQGNPVTRNVNYASDDQHLLSILHISGGFETRMASNMTLQIEPYAKLPLGGVGLGNIRLSSFGINAALQLRQPAKK